MRKAISILCILVTIISLTSCKTKKKQATAQPSDTTPFVTQSVQSTSAQKTDPTSTPTPTATPAPTATPSPTPAAITNDLLQQNMEAVQSYHRKIRIVSTENGQPWEKYSEIAYVKEPFLEYILLDYPQQSTRNETLIIGDIYYDRMNDEKWNKALPGNWFTARPPEFRYELSIQYYPIDYGKLTLQASGNENVNGMDCTKYVVSGGYEDEYTDRDIKYKIKLSGTGEIWISNDAVIKQVLIRQRLKLNADIQTVELKDKDGNLLHAVYEDVIEDDVYDINNTVIQPPPDSEVIVLGGESEEVSEAQDNISDVEGLEQASD
jgi:hypothetical protein